MSTLCPKARRFNRLRSRALTALTTLALCSIPSRSAPAQETPALASASRVATLRSALAEAIPRVLSPRETALGEETKIGIAIIDGATGELLFEKNSQESFVAASNAKLVTTAAALELLGPSFTFQTELLGESISAQGVLRGNLYIRGRGNPLFDDADLARLVRQLRALGVTRIDGQVVVDNSYFDDANLPPHFEEQPDEHAAFRAPIAATSLNFNAFALFVRPSLSGAGPNRIEVRPPNSYVKIVNTSQTTKTGRSHLRMETTEEPKNLKIALSGQLRSEVVRRRFRKRVPDPVLFVGTAVVRALSDAGIALRRKTVIAGSAPETATVLTSHASPPLVTAVHGMGKYSNNFVAEILLKVIGAESRAGGAPATWDHGLGAVRDFLKGIGIAPGTYKYENGSGLFDSNRFTPLQITTVLSHAHRSSKWGSEFFASLAIAGTDGTLSRRMDTSAATAVVRAKTGTLAQASALSGRAAIDGRQPIFFSILVNGFPETSIGIVRAMQDDVVNELVGAL